MPFDPRSNRPSRRYTATPRDTSGAAFFWALVVIAALGVWVVAGSAGMFWIETPAQPQQQRIVAPEPSAD